MKPEGCFKGTKPSYMPKDQAQFDFSCHDPYYFIHQTFSLNNVQNYLCGNEELNILVILRLRVFNLIAKDQ